MRANWVNEQMPWIAPTRGLCQEQGTWPHQVLTGMINMGMREEDNYLLPSPPAVRAGRRPPGATDHLEWATLLRRTLTKMYTRVNPHGSTRTLQGHRTLPWAPNRRLNLNIQLGRLWLEC